MDPIYSHCHPSDHQRRDEIDCSLVPILSLCPLSWISIGKQLSKVTQRINLQLTQVIYLYIFTIFTLPYF